MPTSFNVNNYKATETTVIKENIIKKNFVFIYIFT